MLSRLRARCLDQSQWKTLVDRSQGQAKLWLVGDISFDDGCAAASARSVGQSHHEAEVEVVPGQCSRQCRCAGGGCTEPSVVDRTELGLNVQRQMSARDGWERGGRQATWWWCWWWWWLRGDGWLVCVRARAVHPAEPRARLPLSLT